MNSDAGNSSGFAWVFSFATSDVPVSDLILLGDSIRSIDNSGCLFFCFWLWSKVACGAGCEDVTCSLRFAGSVTEEVDMRLLEVEFLGGLAAMSWLNFRTRSLKQIRKWFNTWKKELQQRRI